LKDRVGIYELLGDIHLLVGAYPPCIEAYQQALELASLPAKRTLLKSKIGVPLTWIGDERGLEYLNAVIHEADPQTQPAELAQSIVGLGRYQHYHGQHRQALQYFQQAYEIAEPLQDPFLKTSIYTCLAGASPTPGGIPAASMDWAPLVEIGGAPEVSAGDRCRRRIPDRRL
jgi:tetratricopeptide (TPR) repeat protein